MYTDLYLKIATADKKNEKKNCILNVKESDINNFALLFITQKQAKNLQRKSNFPSQKASFYLKKSFKPPYFSKIKQIDIVTYFCSHFYHLHTFKS